MEWDFQSLADWLVKKGQDTYIIQCTKEKQGQYQEWQGSAHWIVEAGIIAILIMLLLWYEKNEFIYFI